jgi:hypothetical protein
LWTSCSWCSSSISSTAYGSAQRSVVGGRRGVMASVGPCADARRAASRRLGGGRRSLNACWRVGGGPCLRRRSAVHRAPVPELCGCACGLRLGFETAAVVRACGLRVAGGRRLPAGVRERDFLRVAVWATGPTNDFAERAFLVVSLCMQYVWLDWLASQLASWLELARFNTELQCWLSSLQNQNESSRAEPLPSRVERVIESRVFCSALGVRS